MAKSDKKYKLPWQPWFWGDWFNSIDVQTLPIDSRCVWFEMLGLMWLSDERGYLTKNGKPLSDEQIGFVLRIPVDAFKRHLAVIEASELFSRREDGAIFSRKIIHDQELRDKRSDAGRHGGLATQRQKSAAVVQDPDEPEVLGYTEPTEEAELAGVRE